MQRLFLSDLTLDSDSLDLAYGLCMVLSSPFKAGQRFLGCRENGENAVLCKNTIILTLIIFSGLFLFNHTPSCFYGSNKKRVRKKRSNQKSEEQMAGREIPDGAVVLLCFYGDIGVNIEHNSQG